MTDSDGKVSFSVGSLPAKSIDVFGKKTCDGGEKTWELKGWVTLDDNNFAHIKMEEPLQEMSEGMGLGTDMLAGGWGLLCKGSSKSESASSSESSVSSSSSSSESTTAEPKSRAEILADKKQGINGSIALQENKIAKKNKKLTKDADKLTEQEKQMINLEIAELEAKLALKKIEMEEVDREMSNGRLTKTDRQEFKARKSAAKDNIGVQKDAQKSLKADIKAGKTTSEVKTPVNKSSEPEIKAVEPNSEAAEGTPVESTSQDEIPLTDEQIRKMKMDRNKSNMKLKSLNMELNMKENQLDRKKEKGSLTKSEIKTKEDSIALTKQKIADVEAKIKEFNRQLGDKE